MRYMSSAVRERWAKNRSGRWLLRFGTLLGGVWLGLQGCTGQVPFTRSPVGDRAVQMERSTGSWANSYGLHNDREDLADHSPIVTARRQ